MAALAYSPNGKWLFAGTYNQVQIIQPDSGKLQGTYDLPEPATALAVNSAGTELAVAAGVSGTDSSLFLYSISPSGNLEKPLVIQPAHEDLVQSLHYSKDGNTLVTCGYDRRVKIWEANSGKKLQMLKEHSDSVYSLDFHPGGTLMATGAADRAVKVWGTNPIKLRYTLGESTDWVYAVAWSPDGKHIAAGGVDKRIRVWRANRNQGNIVHSVFAHQAPITHLAYSPDGKILYSVSEDRTFKAWDSYRMVEKKVFAQQPEAIYSFAFHPQKAQLALGRFDGTLLLLDANTGKVQSQPIPAKPKPPQVNSISPQHGPRGKKVNLTFTGKNLRGTIVKSNQPGLKVKIASQKSSKIMNAIVLFPANTSPGEYQLWLENSAGKSKPRTFTVDVSSAKSEMEPNNSPGNGQPM